ncbi:hypothetical protein GBA65_08445 [Rubrobacter marinus]|uniref:Sugar-binding domain-containing protein n=1 Tax=Rubrobacter marinus TaxID=2653852 RepID=A0A6G8PWI4_9ACTN|nr:sugar-binding domain-containing protein [Rubrobacter marinus]QIN78546.1 hypothetical protein GBA65_08445 [Rubrobacter marinus]
MISRYPADRRNLSEEDHLILKVLRLYYERHLTQSEVARRMGFSRPKVSKLISEGRARGLVKIEIATPGEDFAALEIAVEDRHGLAEAVVASSVGDRGVTELSVGASAAAVLGRICTRTTVLGISWGRSSRALADVLIPQAFLCGKVVPLVGGMGRAEAALHSNQIAATLAEKLSAEALYLSAPAIVPSPQSRAELLETPGIEDVLAEGPRATWPSSGSGASSPPRRSWGRGTSPRRSFSASRNGAPSGTSAAISSTRGGRLASRASPRGSSASPSISSARSPRS